jgi:hypothetical protein
LGGDQGGEGAGHTDGGRHETNRAQKGEKSEPADNRIMVVDDTVVWDV